MKLIVEIPLVSSDCESVRRFPHERISQQMEKQIWEIPVLSRQFHQLDRRTSLRKRSRASIEIEYLSLLQGATQVNGLRQSE